MTKKFSSLRSKMDAKARTRSRQRAEELILVMTLNELRLYAAGDAGDARQRHADDAIGSVQA